MRFDPLGDGISCVEYIDHMGSDARIVQAARVSFAKDVRRSASEEEGLLDTTVLYSRPNPRLFEYERDRKLIRYMARHGHSSPFEHNVITYLIECPLFIARQWMRHRTWSYNEVSRRYTSEEMRFYLPRAREIRGQPDSVLNKQASSGEVEEAHRAEEILRRNTAQALKEYETLLEMGVGREQARAALPQNMYTRFYGTVNLFNLYRFVRLRMDEEHAQAEIVLYARALWGVAGALFPEAVTALDEQRQKAQALGLHD